MPDLDDIAPDDTPEEQEGHQLPRTADDYQQAEWLAGAFAGGVRYDHTAKRWHIWDGIRWAPDKTNKITADVMDAAEKRLLMVALNANFSKEKRDHLEKVYRAMRNIGPVGRALETLASRPTYGTDGSDWDQNPNLLGCNNGIVDLRVNALMSDPGPDTLVTRTTGHDFVPFEYSERSGRPLWEQWRGRADRFIRFLEEITSGDQELATFFLQWFGYSLFGHTQEQRFLVLTGIGRNGKGVLVTTMRDVFGEYGAKVDPNMYVRTRFGAARSEGPRADLMALKGARMAAMSEPDGLEFNEELLKAHTGGDPITARTLHSPLMISWVPTHSITFLTNKPPRVEDVGPSMAARVMVADFNERFDGDREDKRLQASLAKEYEGILAILCFVARWWFASPAGLVLPERVRRASAEYISSNDPIGRYIDEACVVGRRNEAYGQALYDAYPEGHPHSEGDDKPLTQTAFGLQLTRRGFTKRGARMGKLYAGIRPKSAVELADELA